VQLYRYFVSQSSDFCRHNPLCCFSTRGYSCCCLFRYRLSPETFWYTLVHTPAATRCKTERNWVQARKTAPPYVKCSLAGSLHTPRGCGGVYLMKYATIHCTHSAALRSMVVKLWKMFTLLYTVFVFLKGRKMQHSTTPTNYGNNN
jgi:hypothetical protein